MFQVLYHCMRRRWIGPAEAVRLAKFLKRRGIPWRAVFAAALAPPTPPEAIDQSHATSLVLSAFDDDDWKAAIIEGLADEDFTEQLVAAVRALPPTDIMFLEQGQPV